MVIVPPGGSRSLRKRPGAVDVRVVAGAVVPVARPRIEIESGVMTFPWVTSELAAVGGLEVAVLVDGDAEVAKVNALQLEDCCAVRPHTQTSRPARRS